MNDTKTAEAIKFVLGGLDRISVTCWRHYGIHGLQLCVAVVLSRYPQVSREALGR